MLSLTHTLPAPPPGAAAAVVAGALFAGAEGNADGTHYVTLRALLDARAAAHDGATDTTAAASDQAR